MQNIGRNVMNAIKMNREELLKIVRANKEKHEAAFIESVADHAVAMIVIAEKNKKVALANTRITLGSVEQKLSNKSLLT